MMKIDKNQKTLYALSILGALLYISLIFNNNLWMDEAFSAVLVNTDFKTMLSRSASDTLPPLYNVLNWCMTQIVGFRAPALKLCSVIPMICVLFMIPTIVYKRFGFMSAAIFTICMTGMPSMFFYGVEIRMYALSLFFVTAAGIYAFECYYEPSFKSYFLFTLFIIGASYTHHFAFVSSGVVWFILFLSLLLTHKKNIRFSLYSLVAIFICYIPCAFSTLNQMQRVNGYFSMPEMSLNVILSALRNPFITYFTPLSILLLLLFITVPVYVAIKQKDLKALLPFVCCSLIFILTLSFGVFVTLVFKASIFSIRYLFPSYGLLWLGFSTLFNKMYLDKKVLILSSAILLLTLISTYRTQLISEYADGVNAMTEYFDKNVDIENDEYIIYEDNYQVEICFRYYFPGFQKTDWKHSDSCTGNLWYIEMPAYEEKAGTIEANGYTKEYVGDFSFDRYSFKLYKLSK